MIDPAAPHWLTALEQTAVAAAARGDDGWEWLYPYIETFHVLCIAMVYGSILMVDLRLLGVSSRDSAVTMLSRECLPYTWSAFVGAVITGSIMFASKAHVFYYNLQFELKFLCLFIAGANMLIFHFGIYRRVLSWDRTSRLPLPARIAGGLSIACWTAVIFFGRWAGWNT